MLLKVDQLSKRYGKRWVLQGINLVVEPGEIMGLLGRNGAGKTTTFKIIAGLIRPDSGRIYLDGKDITYLPVYKRARCGMGFLPQEPSVFQGLTVEENLQLILEFYEPDRRARRKLILQRLEEYGLLKLAKQKANTLSGGEMRRVEICRAMLLNPTLLMLDEPFTGIDPICVADLQGIIKDLKNRGVSILLTDHNVRDTLIITDRAYIIDEGLILAEGTREQIIGNPLVRQRYLGDRFQI
jgi:lipopolysaccharide export system ATP-binding protein